MLNALSAALVGCVVMAKERMPSTCPKIRAQVVLNEKVKPELECHQKAGF